MKFSHYYTFFIGGREPPACTVVGKFVTVVRESRNENRSNLYTCRCVNVYRAVCAESDAGLLVVRRETNVHVSYFSRRVQTFERSTVCIWSRFVYALPSNDVQTPWILQNNSNGRKRAR